MTQCVVIHLYFRIIWIKDRYNIKMFFTTMLITTSCWEYNSMSWFNLIYIPHYTPLHLLMNMIAISVKPNFLTRYYKFPFEGNNQNLTLIKDMSCSYLFLEYLVCWFNFYFCNLFLVSILIFHMFHSQQYPYSYNWNI